MAVTTDLEPNVLLTLATALFKGAKNYTSTFVRRLDVGERGQRPIITVLEQNKQTNGRFAEMARNGDQVALIRDNEENRLTHAVNVTTGDIFPLSDNSASGITLDEVVRLAGGQAKNAKVVLANVPNQGRRAA